MTMMGMAFRVKKSIGEFEYWDLGQYFMSARYADWYEFLPGVQLRTVGPDEVIEIRHRTV
jgi:hypothetical protein